MTLILRPVRLHWIDETKDDPADLCVHSPVEAAVNGVPLVKPEAGDWTVSVASLYLLRTLWQPHDETSRVGDHLFPCCGFTMYDVDEPDALIIGCPSGADFGVQRDGDLVRLLDPGGARYELSFSDWRDAVCTFSDIVRDFYDRASCREPADDEDAKGFRVFLAEWMRRREAAASLT